MQADEIETQEWLLKHGGHYRAGHWKKEQVGKEIKEVDDGTEAAQRGPSLRIGGGFFVN